MSYETLSQNSPEARSASPIPDNVEALAKLFPSVVQDGQVDFNALKTLLGEAIEEDDKERFGLHWHGKKEARRFAMEPSFGTLRPCKEESVDWDTTKNLYIEGDNLEVLKLLRKSYSGKVKMIYIDPPYNTGGDFVYEDKFKDGMKDYLNFSRQSEKLPINQETNGRFHTRWLNMMYPRLQIAKDLLTEDGVIFVSLDDHEMMNFKCIADEIFGMDCFVTTIHCQMSTTQGMKVKAAQEGNIVKNSEYILCYSRNGRKNIASRLLYDLRPEYDGHYTLWLNDNGSVGSLKQVYNFSTPKDIPHAKSLSIEEAYRKSNDFANFVKDNISKIARIHEVSFHSNCSVEVDQWTEVEIGKKKYLLTRDSKGQIKQLLKLKDSWGRTDGYYRQEGLRKIRGDWWEGFYMDMGNVSDEGGVKFKNGKKPIRLIQQLAYMVTKDNDIVLDFFSGSATTAHAIIQNNYELNLNARWILVQLPEKVTKNENDFNTETICDIGKERIRRAGKKIKEEAGLPGQKLDVGFRVYKLDSSNVRVWNPEVNEEDLVEAMYRQAEHLVAGRTSEDFLTEIMLKCGIDLVEQMGEREIEGHKIQSLGYGQYYACMDNDIAKDVERLAHGIVEWHAEETRQAGVDASDTCTVFVLDQAFDGKDAAKMNFVAILEQYGIHNVKAF